MNRKAKKSIEIIELLEKLKWIMALHVPKAPGFAQMMKEGARVSYFIYNLRLKSHVFG